MEIKKEFHKAHQEKNSTIGGGVNIFFQTRTGNWVQTPKTSSEEGQKPRLMGRGAVKKSEVAKKKETWERRKRTDKSKGSQKRGGAHSKKNHRGPAYQGASFKKKKKPPEDQKNEKACKLEGRAERENLV